jgi:phosphate transport system substrate-binding protein
MVEGNQSMNHNPLRSRYLMPALLVTVLLVAGCSRGNKDAITVAGSTSVEPFAELLAEHYMALHPGVKISVQGGGSSAGIRAVTSRICAIGMSSRELHPEEKNLTEIAIALDAIALIVNAGNPVQRLTLEQARDVFAGRIRNWRQLGGPDRRITAITREEGSGTRASFEEMVMAAGQTKDSDGKREPAAFAADALVQDSNGAVREVVASDPAAVGYISSGLVDERVAAVVLNGVNPTEAAIRSGQYPVVRQFLFLTNGEATGTAKEFINYVLSDSGQNALVEEGLTRVR